MGIVYSVEVNMIESSSLGISASTHSDNVQSSINSSPGRSLKKDSGGDLGKVEDSRDLNSECIETVPDEVLCLIFKRCITDSEPNIDSLARVSHRFHDVVTSTIPEAINENHLSLAQTGVTNFSEALAKVQEIGEIIEHLDLSGIDINDEELFRLLKNCPNIRSLSVFRCRKLTDAAILDERGVGKLTNLAMLHVGGCSFSNEAVVGVRGIGSMKNLKDLDVSFCVMDDDAVLDSNGIASMQNIERLNIGGCPITDRAAREGIAAMEQLKVLDVEDCSLLTTNSLSLLENKFKLEKFY